MTLKILIRLLTYLTLTGLVMLQGCAAREQAVPGMKIGMHIDAVLEFVVEYPLEWEKDRRLNYGSNEGEVRWIHPEDNGTMLRILSRQVDAESNSPEQRLASALYEYPDLVVTSNEEVDLPTGDAFHLTAHSTQDEIEVYMLLTAKRQYIIALTTSRNTASEYDVIMDRVSQSFKILQ